MVMAGGPILPACSDLLSVSCSELLNKQRDPHPGALPHQGGAIYELVLKDYDYDYDYFVNS